MIDVELGPVSPEEMSEAAALAARAMQDSPASIAMLGSDPGWRVRMLAPVFEMLLQADPTPPLGARRSGVLVGLGALSMPGDCMASQMQQRSASFRLAGKRVSISAPSIPWNLLPALLRMGPGALNRVSQMGGEIAMHDLPEQHAHLQILAVEPAVHGMGIGTRIMRELCARVDAGSETMVLETDKARNVEYYRGFGFDVRETTTILGVTYWFMARNRADQ